MVNKVRNLRGQAVLTIVFIAAAFLVVFPFLLVLSISLSNEQDVINGGYSVIPKNWDLSAYKYVFRNPLAITRAYGVTAEFSSLSMILGVLLMSMLAYPLSKKSFRYRNIFSFVIYFTMLFSGGLVPSYILITQYLHLDDTIWVYVIPSLISPWYVFMLRTFFAGLPGEISESMLIDGANEYTIFFRMVIPLSKPVIATVALMVFLGKWNDWYTALLYINEDRLISLQYLLQKMMNNIKLLQEAQEAGVAMTSASNVPSETVRMAMAVVVAGPALFIFPFFQKYFVRGLTVGAVKG